tara:strand:- start:68 stop:349 length:282 start_codon:yes stop_codon:yes gene_type:complete
MAKQIKEEIEVFLKNNPEIDRVAEEDQKIQAIYSCLPKKLMKGVKEILIKKNTVIIKTKTPSWKQEINFFKKEIMKKIDKKFRNYDHLEITIL